MRPSSTASRRIASTSSCISGSRAFRRLVQHEHLRPRHQRDDEADLLVVAPRERADPSRAVEGEPLDELVAVPRVHAAPECGDEVEARVDPERVVEGEVAGEVAAAAAHLDGVALGVEAEHLRMARVGDG